MTRRDKCYLTGKRAMNLHGAQASKAWEILAVKIEEMGLEPMPKFKHLIGAIRSATIEAKGKR